MDSAPSSEVEPNGRAWAGYWCMIVQQTQNAFNDKAAQFLLIPLGGWLAGRASRVELVAGLMIALPFVLFAPLAGWVSDRFAKRNVMIGAAVAQIVILLSLTGAVVVKSLPLAMVGFFALAVQSAFFSPAKLGIVKELVGTRHLGFASGVQQMTSMLAILAGQIAAGIIFSSRLADTNDGWHAALGPLVILTLLSLPAVVLARVVPLTPPGNAGPLTPSLMLRHVSQLRDLWRDPVLKRTSLGVAFFWGFAGFINLWSIGVAKDLTGGGTDFGRLSSTFMIAASLGMAAGFGVASLLLRRRIELGWVPLAGVAMTVCCLLLALADPAGSAFGPLLAITAFAGAIFLAPLNAHLQDRCPPEKRGEMLAASNLQDCIAGIGAVAFVAAVNAMGDLPGMPAGLGLRLQPLVVALTCGAITLFIIKLIPAELVRVTGLALIRLVYRIETTGTADFPRRGGVLLLPNHVTWADAFFLTAACPRPVRFVMDQGFMGNAAIRVFCRLFDTVPISTVKPREALRASADALKQGHVVCIFPEGQLTRTGTLQPLKRGFELIARQAGCPVVMAWNAGAWGSILSFEGGRFFTKVPRQWRLRMAVAFSPPMPPASVDPVTARHAMLDASAKALALLTDGRGPAVANGLQLGQVNGLPRGGDFGTLAGDPLPDRLPGLEAFADLHRSIRREADEPDPSLQPHWIGGSALRTRLERGMAGDLGVFFDFSDRAAIPLDVAGWLHCPCLAVEGVIVAMTLPDPPQPGAAGHPQTGRKEGSCGLLLPGFSFDADTGMLHGPSAPDGVALPPGWTVDDDGFLVRAGA